MIKICEDCICYAFCGYNVREKNATGCTYYIPSNSTRKYLQGYVDGFACGEQGDIAKYNDACERLEAMKQADKEIEKRNTEMPPLPNEYKGE